jgi:hypothetical protein
LSFVDLLYGRFGGGVSGGRGTEDRFWGWKIVSKKPVKAKTPYLCGIRRSFTLPGHHNMRISGSHLSGRKQGFIGST